MQVCQFKDRETVAQDLRQRGASTTAWFVLDEDRFIRVYRRWKDLFPDVTFSRLPAHALREFDRDTTAIAGLQTTIELVSRDVPVGGLFLTSAAPSRRSDFGPTSVLSPKYEVFCRGSVGCFSRRERSAHIFVIPVERATRKNSQLAPAQRVAMKMDRRLRCSSVTYRFRYAPSSRLAGGPF